jgi:uncharacterized Rmd1/YagE family protein
VAYRDLSRARRVSRQVSRGLREIRVDLARLNDELLNITKFFGDWHLARIYENISARFHLADWHRTIDKKLQTLDDLYQLLNHDQTNRWMLILELTIVLLFVIDLVVLVLGIKWR